MAGQVQRPSPTAAPPPPYRHHETTHVCVADEVSAGAAESSSDLLSVWGSAP